MPRHRVADIAELVARQQARNQKLLDDLQSCCECHPDVDPDDIIPSVLSRFAHGEKCPECHCSMVTVESKSEGDRVQVCRDVIGAIKMASLIVDRPGELWLASKYKYNPNGMVSGAIHQTIQIDDYDVTPREGPVVRVQGLRSRITAGKVSIGDAGEVILES